MTEPLYVQFLALLAAAMLIPAFVFLAHGLHHRNMPFWWVLATSNLALFVGSTLGALRTFLPATFAPLASNVLIGIGYFLCLRALRMIKNEWRFHRLDAALTVVFLTGFSVLFTFWNGYEHRVALVSAHIALMSFIVLLIALSPQGRISLLGDVIIAFFGIGNVLMASARSLSALLANPPSALSLALWDPIFFVWSISAVFCIAIGYFINGTAALTRETRETLTKEQRLTAALSDALEGQRGLQKLMLHELKRPINAISSTVQASYDDDATRQQHSWRKLRHLSKEAEAYLQSISAFEEMNALLDTPERTALSVAALAGDLNNKWEIPVDLSPETADSRILADELMMDIALGNLIENARKFGKNSTNTRMRIALDGAQITFDVSDDGAGIPTAEQEKVFGKFYKMVGSSDNALKGCGLGLYVVSRIAQAHDGYARVMNQTPSTLRFAIPALGER